MTADQNDRGNGNGQVNEDVSLDVEREDGEIREMPGQAIWSKGIIPLPGDINATDMPSFARGENP
ncbi:MAG: hypothetical protein PHC60_10110 [Heliobacteriaceae bacterium]|nr:hypothetical protein [Heliobacteriaceae bacterium]